MKPLILILAFLCIAASPLIRLDKTLGKDLSVYPSLSPPGRVSSKFGVPRRGHAHAGMDIVGCVGTPIRAVGGGTVVFAGYEQGYGITVIVHAYNLDVVYAHLLRARVRAGDEIKRGKVIGDMGYSGDTRPAGPEGCHLHIEYRIKGVPVDPAGFMIE